MMRRCSLPLVLGLAISFGVACGPAEQVKDEPLPRDPNGAVTILNPTQYKPMIGESAIEVEVVIARDVKKMELFVGDQAEPVVVSEALTDTLLWDASLSPVNAMQQIFVRVTDKADIAYDSAPVQVVVMGSTGHAATMTDGRAGSIFIPAAYNGTQEVDRKHHWTNPAGTTRVIGIATFEKDAAQEDWNLAVAMGHGECPHSGTKWADEVPGTSQDTIVVDIDLTPFAGTQLVAGMAFIHVAPKIGTAAPYAHLGEALPYTFSVYLFE